MPDRKLPPGALLVTALLLTWLATACQPPGPAPVPAVGVTRAPVLNLTLNPNTTSLYSARWS